jgi:hypothetical protein
MSSFRATDCDSDHCMVLTKVRKRLAVNKQRSHRFHMERHTLKKLNEVERKEKYHAEVSSRFAGLEDLEGEVDINVALESIRDTIKIKTKDNLGYYDLKKHKTWFNKRCSELLDQTNQAN